MKIKGLTFTGEFIHQLDEKCRFKLPAKLLTALRKNYPEDCVLMRMPDKCLAIFPAEVWEENCARILSGMGPAVPGTSDYRKLTRILGANSIELSIGAQNRIALPDGYRDYIGAKPGADIAVIGAGTRIEIWNADQWKASEDADLQGYAELVERTLSGFGGHHQDESNRGEEK